MTPLPGVMKTAANGDPGVVSFLSITPAFADALVFVSELINAITFPLPIIVVLSKLNWSAVPKMSAPLPEMVVVSLGES
jgi:hypothetical protein